MPVVTEYATQTISVVGRYTHLGSIAHPSGLSHRELRRRIAIGNAAFTLLTGRLSFKMDLFR